MKLKLEAVITTYAFFSNENLYASQVNTSLPQERS